jgi:predicted TPR repeat methyltransferase
MPEMMNAALHDAYAAGYDAEVRMYDCHIAEVLFGLVYEYIRPGQALLDAGIGSGLSAELFAKAGLEIHGMDFSPVMLEICLRKGLAADLQQHDLQQVPWPYPSARFDHLVCCGVLHFLPDLDGAVGEAARLARPGGTLAVTTKWPPAPLIAGQKYDCQTVGGFEIYSHSPEYLAGLLEQAGYERLKTQKCFVGDDIFVLWIARRRG